MCEVYITKPSQRNSATQLKTHTRIIRIRKSDAPATQTARRFLKHVISRLGRLSYLAGGMSIRVFGQQAARHEAAVLVLAPHSSFLDSVIVYVTNMCSVMVRKESMDNYAGSKLGVDGSWGWGGKGFMKSFDDDDGGVNDECGFLVGALCCRAHAQSAQSHRTKI